MSLPVLVVHGRPQALALRRLCPEVELLLPPHYVFLAGAQIVQAAIEGLDPPPIVDCEAHIGHALAMVRTRIPRILFTGSAEIHAKLADMGAQNGLIVFDRLVAPRFELDAMDTKEKTFRHRLQQAGWSF